MGATALLVGTGVAAAGQLAQGVAAYQQGRYQAEVANEIGSKVIAVTSHPESPLSNFTDEVIVVKGRQR